MSGEYLDQFTRIDDLMRTSVKLSKETMQIIFNTNRNINDMLHGNVVQTGLINYEQIMNPALTPAERKAHAKKAQTVIDPRDGKAFYIQKIIVDEYSKNVNANIRFTTPPYRYNTAASGTSLFEGFSYSDVISALGLTSNPFRRDNLMITNIKFMGYHNSDGHPSSHIKVIFGTHNLPPVNSFGMPRTFMKSYDPTILSPSYGISVGDEDIIEFDFSENPVILRWDFNDNWFFDWENLSGAEEHLRRAITYCVIEPVLS